MNQPDTYHRNTYQNKSRDAQGRRADPPAPLDAPMPLPKNFVDEAERVMQKMGQDSSKGGFSITTSKIRNLLSLAIEIYHQEYLRTEETLLEESMDRIQMMRVRMLYETGRDKEGKEFKAFLQQSHLLNYLKNIGNSRIKLIRYTQYLEALVAYHRYYGGSEN